MTTSSPTSLLIQDLINAPSKAESILESLSPEQILMIENTLMRVKRKKLEKAPKKESEVVSVPVEKLTISPAKLNNNTLSNSNEPMAELKEGVEWVSFVYSHNRTLKRYSIRTDIQHVEMDSVDDKFKAENCVYPRANLPKETYKGNRWNYETECNDLGWKLAWLNKTEIAGKRGLIQRAVDSYRNRYPSMRSRRVARQEKLLNGTLRKRKNRDEEDESTDVSPSVSISSSLSLDSLTVKPAHQPKTIAIDDITTQTRYRIKINVETVLFSDLSEDFCKKNCPFPRAIQADPESYPGGQTRWSEDTICNELSWKLAYLNPRVLAGKKSLLQRALDIYRTKFMPTLKPRKRSSRTVEQPLLKVNKPLTVSALDAQNALIEKKNTKKMKQTIVADTMMKESIVVDPMISPSYDSMYSDSNFSPFDESISCHTSTSSSVACTPSPPVSADLFGFTDTDIYDSFMLPPVNDSFMLFENNDMKCYDLSPSTEFVKLEQDFQDNYASAAHLLDPLF